MALEERTPLMIAASYGSLEVVKLILSLSSSEVNKTCGSDMTSALHCAASSGSVNAVNVVKLLLAAGANIRTLDAYNRRPYDVISVSPHQSDLKTQLEDLLGKLRISVSSSSPESPHLLDDDGSGSSDSASSPKTGKHPERKEYPLDPSLPDIKNSVYSTDEFRMFSFKVRPCSRAYSHDWTECPFVHPGENARRRDPRKYHYSCVPCPDFRKGSCRRGDLCEYAHGVFECWLHPAQYRTRLCKDGISCNRRVCFFAHTPEELRPLYMATGSAVPSPRSPTAAMEMAAAMNMMPGSPSSLSMMSHSLAWPAQSSLPSLSLPGSSRLRSSLSARDVPADDMNELHGYSSSPLPRLGRSNSMAPSNLDDLFSAEMGSSPSYFSPNSVESPLTRNSFVQHPHSPRNGWHPAFSQMENQQKQKLRSLSSRDLTYSGSPSSPSMLNWGSPGGKLDWAVNEDELRTGNRFFRNSTSSSFEIGNAKEHPDLSWVQSLVKESPSETKEEIAVLPASSINQGEGVDQTVLGAWLEQMQLDQLVAL